MMGAYHTCSKINLEVYKLCTGSNRMCYLVLTDEVCKECDILARNETRFLPWPCRLSGLHKVSFAFLI